MNARSWIVSCGIVWFVIGFSLLLKGLQFTSSLSWITLGFFLGLCKGYFVLNRSVRRITVRIRSLPLPIRIKDIYGFSYLILIAAMMSLGFLLRFVPDHLRGMIDVAIGTALIYGSSQFFTYGIGSRVRSP